MAHQQLIHLHPAPHEYLLEMDKKQSLSSLSSKDRDGIGRILLAGETNSFLRASLKLFDWDLNEIPPVERVKMGAFFRKKVMGLSVEQAAVANWIMEKVIPYSEQCQKQIVFRSYESFLNLLHLVEQLSFITEQVIRDEEARTTWMFDWQHIVQSDVEYYGFLQHRVEYNTVESKLLYSHLRRAKAVIPLIQIVGTNEEFEMSKISFKRGASYVSAGEHIEMEYQKPTAFSYSVSVSE